MMLLKAERNQYSLLSIHQEGRRNQYTVISILYGMIESHRVFLFLFTEMLFYTTESLTSDLEITRLIHRFRVL